MNQSGEACNVNGVGNHCGGPSGSGCGTCKEPYFGSRCQYCKPGIPVFDGQNGTVDIEGKGPLCGNLYMIEKEIKLFNYVEYFRKNSYSHCWRKER